MVDTFKKLSEKKSGPVSVPSRPVPLDSLPVTMSDLIIFNNSLNCQYLESGLH